MQTICSLAFEPAINAIKDTETVMYKHGVWNKFYERKTSEVIESIKKSGYGADVSYNEAKGIYYVSIPCDADMW